MVTEIPIDERTGKPMVTSAMKAECIGEFTITEQLTCTSCYYDEVQPDCEVCSGEVTYDQKFTIPWTTCKDIYKRMAEVASAGVTLNLGKAQLPTAPYIATAAAPRSE